MVSLDAVYVVASLITRRLYLSLQHLRIDDANGDIYNYRVSITRRLRNSTPEPINNSNTTGNYTLTELNYRCTFCN